MVSQVNRSVVHRSWILLQNGHIRVTTSQDKMWNIIRRTSSRIVSGSRKPSCFYHELFLFSSVFLQLCFLLSTLLQSFWDLVFLIIFWEIIIPQRVFKTVYVLYVCVCVYIYICTLYIKRVRCFDPRNHLSSPWGQHVPSGMCAPEQGFLQKTPGDISGTSTPAQGVHNIACMCIFSGVISSVLMFMKKLKKTSDFLAGWEPDQISHQRLG